MLVRKLTIFTFLSLGVFLILPLDGKVANQVLTCNEINQRIDLRIRNMESSLSYRAQTMGNIESSLKSKIEEARNINPEEVIKLESNYESFRYDSDKYLMEREFLIERLVNLKKIDCDKNNLDFTNKLKSFNQSYKNHLRKHQNLAKDLNEDLLIPLNKILSKESNER